MPLQSFLLTLFRVLAVFMLAPVVSAHAVPVRAKIGLALFICLVLWPAQGATFAEPIPLLLFGVAVLKEVLIGTLVGFSAHLITAAAQVAGSVADLQVGFRAGTVVNPLTALPSSLAEQVYYLMASLFFLALDGHHALILALSDTFNTLPVGSPLGLDGSGAQSLSLAVQSCLVSGMKIAFPVLAITLMVDAVLAILSRVVPQIQVFFVGLPVKFVVGLAAVLLTVPGFLFLVHSLLRDMPRQTLWLLEVLGR